MAFKLIWSPSAKLDLKDITAFIAEGSMSAAERFVGSPYSNLWRDWRISQNPGEWSLSSVTPLFVK